MKEAKPEKEEPKEKNDKTSLKRKHMLKQPNKQTKTTNKNLQVIILKK